MTMTAAYSEADDSRPFRRRAMFGAALIALLFGGVGGWASVSTLSGAVIASGQIVDETSIKKVQHPTGGIVGKINVKNGDKVDAGDVLVTLDDTQTRANLDVVRSQLTELTGRKARLAAERDGANDIEFPADFAASYREAPRVMSGETRLFEARRRSNAEQKGQLKERIGQFKNEITGLKSQEAAKAKELLLVREELARVSEMYAKSLTPVTRVLQMRRDVTRIAGEHGALLSQIARTEGQVSETELKIIELDSTLRADAQKELRDVEAKMGELTQRQVAAEDMLMRVDIKSPRNGTVHEMTIHTVGGVISPGETIMGIVPLGDEKVIEARVAPTDIDQVIAGQHAVLRFPAFNQRTTPELDGHVSVVASDVSKDPQTGAPYYSVRVRIDDAALPAFRKLKIVTGMPVECFIQTGERTAISYLAKPFRDQLARAFRED